MAVFKRGKVYWFQFVFEGRRVQVSTKQHSREDAKTMESAHRTALAKGEFGITKKKDSVLQGCYGGFFEMVRAGTSGASRNTQALSGERRCTS